MPPEDNQVIACALRDALERIHMAGFVHCDIKLENTLILNKSDVRSVVLADFGSARKLPDNGPRLRGRHGTRGYQAPELFCSRDPEFSTPVDIWSFGILLALLFTGIDHFHKAGFPSDWSQDDMDERFRIALEANNAPDDAIEAIRRMLQIDPAERPTATQLKELDYFTVTEALTKATKNVLNGLDAPDLDA
jgi:serine/threonine protein kinase